MRQPLLTRGRKFNVQPILDYIEARGWTQIKFCDHVGISDEHTLCRWKRGESQPSNTTAFLLCSKLGIKFDELFPKVPQ
jgi:transcriptional regulator with XRE-family HTH domain